MNNSLRENSEKKNGPEIIKIYRIRTIDAIRSGGGGGLGMHSIQLICGVCSFCGLVRLHFQIW